MLYYKSAQKTLSNHWPLYYRASGSGFRAQGLWFRSVVWAVAYRSLLARMIGFGGGIGFGSGNVDSGCTV